MRFGACMISAQLKNGHGIAHQIASAICCKKIEKRILVGHQIANAPNRICDMQQIAHEIAHEIARVIIPLGGEILLQLSFVLGKG
jgi:hypothetical protein